MGQQTEGYERDETIQIKSSRLYKKLKRIIDNDDSLEDSGCAVSDILADLRHICDEKGFDFAELDRVGYAHYRAEIGSKHAAEKAACRAARAGHAGIAETDL